MEAILHYIGVFFLLIAALFLVAFVVSGLAIAWLKRVTSHEDQRKD